MSIKPAVKTSFSKVLKKYRSAAKMSQKELSEKSGLHRNEIGLLERKKRAPSLETIIKIAGGLGISASELMDEFFEIFETE
jgi:transcriptional regulator with XRE-family HTH domain